ncbi:MAG: mechanosensitive ion channel family protein [Gemmatimonadetes bacterium]|nr:mechanosensitive ion channel family protein [Gemmatimonadota bacterium]
MEQEATTWMHAMEGWFNYYVPEMVRNILPAILALIAIIIAHKITKRLLIKAMQHQKREDADIRQLQSLLKYAFMLAGIVFVIASLSGSLAAMGLTAAFLSMVLGWSLQRPVTGVAAWLMVMIKRPFQIRRSDHHSGRAGRRTRHQPDARSVGRGRRDHWRRGIIQSRHFNPQCSPVRPDGHQLRGVRGSQVYSR